MMINESAISVEPAPPAGRIGPPFSTEMAPDGWRLRPAPHAQIELTERLNKSEATTFRQPPTKSVKNYSRKTKIISTLGPETENGEVLRGMLQAGANAFCLNMTCIERESALKAVYAIRSISSELRRPVSLLLGLRPLCDGADFPTINENDWSDIRFGLDCGVDWIVAPAQREGNPVRQLRQFLTEQKRSNIGILAQITGPIPPNALAEIIQDADGVVLSDCVTANPQTAEMHCDWRFIVQKCVSVLKPVVITIGTTAKVTAVLSAGPDGALLAEAMDIGSNPLRNVQRLDELIRHQESIDQFRAQTVDAVAADQSSTVAMAVQQADEMKADAIVAFTRQGNLAHACAALRPRQSRVFAFTPDARLARRLSLRYAIESVTLSLSDEPNVTVSAAEKALLKRKLLPPGARVVFIRDGVEQGECISSIQTLALGKGKVEG